MSLIPEDAVQAGAETLREPPLDVAYAQLAAEFNNAPARAERKAARSRRQSVLRQAIDVGERSGEPEQFDFDEFVARKRAGGQPATGHPPE